MQHDKSEDDEEVRPLTEAERHKIYNPTGAVGNLGQDVPFTGNAGEEVQDAASDFYEGIGAVIMGKDDEDGLDTKEGEAKR